MKRSRDGESSSGVAAPDVSSRASGVSGVVVNGSGVAVAPPTAANDAWAYVIDVKDTFQDQREKYDSFREVLLRFKAQGVGIAGVVDEVKELFQGHPNLILGFNRFLPKEYAITLMDEMEAPRKSSGVAAAGSKQNLTLNDAWAYLKDVKNMLGDQREKYNSFLEIMTDCRLQRVGTADAVGRVKELFKGHPTLILGFNKFLPDGDELVVDEKLPKASLEDDAHSCC